MRSSPRKEDEESDRASAGPPVAEPLLSPEILAVPQMLSAAESGKDLSHAKLSRQTLPRDGSQKPQFWSPGVDNDLEGRSSGGTGSNTQPGNSEPARDRVFPMRSVVSVDASQTPAHLGDQQDYFPTMAAAVNGADTGNSPRRGRHSLSNAEANGRPTPNSLGQRDLRSRGEEAQLNKSEFPSSKHSRSGDYGGESRVRLFSDNCSEKSSKSTVGDSGSITSAVKSGLSRSSCPRTGSGHEIGGLLTARFKHIVTAEGHALVTGHGEALQRCEDEPIHIPGAIQNFGLLIALQEVEEGELVIRIVSENSYRLIGYTPQDLFKLKSFTDILSEDQTDNLLDHVDFIRDEEVDPANNGPEVFTLSIKTYMAPRKVNKLWCAMHVNPSNPDFIICEFELDDDHLHPLTPSNDDTPEIPEDTLHNSPTAEEYAESTQSTSKPLRVLRSARKRRGEAAAMEVFNIMSQVQEQLASAPNLDNFLKILVGVVKELTGFHRVMIYQFSKDFNGRVVTEIVDPRATKDLYKGLNFPASDIPKQARDLYKINKVRLLYDRDAETARLVCRTVEDLEQPLDLSFSYLRAMSPIHIQYLGNMAVRSSMSISINAFNELWGLIALHSYGSQGMRVSFPIRKMCRLVGDTASRNIERLSYVSRLQARKLINTAPSADSPSGYIIASSDDLLKLFDADFGLLSIKGETKILGKLDHSQEILAMLEYLRLRKITSVITSQDVKEDFPDLRYSPGFNVIAGLLLVPLSIGGSDFIVFFRRGQVKEVKWAGNPYEKAFKGGTAGYLEPRKSFKTWSETVVGKCREWTEEQVETAAVLCLVYGKFIEVWRQKEAALQSSQLTRLLLANSAHEVRTPLNAIINYLEIALEGAIDQETRDNLAKSHSASKSLIYVINDLLDLTKAEEGQNLVKDDVFDLWETVREATDSFKGDAKRKGLGYEIIEHPGIPQFVLGDQRRIRQIISNITANAIQNTNDGWVRIEVWLQGVAEDKTTVEIVVQDSGVGMSSQKLDALFRDLEQVTTEGDVTPSEEPTGDLSAQENQGNQKRALGLGLAMVARIVRTMDGQLRLKSEEGKGSRFVIQLPFVLPPKGSALTGENSMRLAMGVHEPTTSMPLHHGATEGEVTLVEKTSSLRAQGIIHKHSFEEASSVNSFRSGSSNKSNASKRSDVDRLIDALSGPLSVGEPESEERSLQRSSSKGGLRSRNSASTTMQHTPLNSISHDSRPGKLGGIKSYVAPEHLRSHAQGPAGSEFVTDNKMPLKAVRMPDEFAEATSSEPPSHVAPKVFFAKEDVSAPAMLHKTDAEDLQILVAEDDPVNSRIIQKRLEKSGHHVYHTVNGEDCATAYGEKSAFFDVVLMDMQMPIVDGLTATKMIRSFENLHPSSNLSARAAINGRVPIFAVSASLVECESQIYIHAGFDGWILKPIDFKRLNTLLLGIVEDNTRNSCLYQIGQWERGGWFHRRQPTIHPTDPVSPQKRPNLSLPQNDGISSSSESGSVTPKLVPLQKPPIMERQPDEVEGRVAETIVLDVES